MKLHAPIYTSPIPTEGTFTDVYVEEKNFLIQRDNRLFAIEFEMYYLKEGKKIIFPEPFRLEFRGNNTDPENSNRTTLVLVPNPDYAAQVAVIPTELLVTNPDYDAELEGSEPFIYVANPNYVAQVAGVHERVEVPLFKYVAENGAFPADYEIVDWGFPTYQTVLLNFDGGNLEAPELFLNNDFAKGWLLNNVYMKGEALFKQFNFVE